MCVYVILHQGMTFLSCDECLKRILSLTEIRVFNVLNDLYFYLCEKLRILTYFSVQAFRTIQRYSLLFISRVAIHGCLTNLSPSPSKRLVDLDSNFGGEWGHPRDGSGQMHYLP